MDERPSYCTECGLPLVEATSYSYSVSTGEKVYHEPWVVCQSDRHGVVVYNNFTWCKHPIWHYSKGFLGFGKGWKILDYD